jgi:hypothetical protein
MLKGVQTSDFGIDPYLSLNDASLFFQELFKKYEIDPENLSQKSVDAAQSLAHMSRNMSLQMDQDELLNIGFKQYITENVALIDVLPADIKSKVLNKAKIKPF